MCLVINKKQCPNGYKTARKNIPCYKLLLKTSSGTFETPYMREPVDIKTGIEATYFQTKPTNKLRIYQGVHSYTNLISANSNRNSWYNLMDATIHKSVVILKGYIPKGTKYWVGMWGTFCSERIVFA